MNISKKKKEKVNKSSKPEKVEFPGTDKNYHIKEYENYSKIRHLIVNDIKEYIENFITVIETNPLVNGRIKSFSSYFSKYLHLLKNGTKDPKITDLMGVRIICPFIDDLQEVENLIYKNFEVIEEEKKGHFSYKEFGYESIHLLVKIPEQYMEKHGYPGIDIAEIQIRTILQDAWAEVEHELVYKAEFSPLDEPIKRKLAAINASLSLADLIFQEIRTYQREYSRQIVKRRKSFYKKIEESTDELLFIEKPKKSVKNDSIIKTKTKTVNNIPEDTGFNIDDLLIKALSAHNKNRFNEAINLYTKILDLRSDALQKQNVKNSRSDEMLCSIIFKHRGMAYFACSQYSDAIKDFSLSLEYDMEAYKSAYYRGVVYSVLKQYSQAIDDYTLSLSINPYQSFCLFRRGQAYYHIGDYPQGLADCENSLALEPDNESALKFKELLLNKLKM